MNWLPEAAPKPPVDPLRDHRSRMLPEYVDGVPVRLRWVPCRCDECEAAWAALRASPDELRRRLR